MSCCCQTNETAPMNQIPPENGSNESTAEEQIVKETNTFKENIRIPTDILFLVIFLIFIVILAILSAYAFTFGHPERLINSVDSEGRICGVSDAVKNKPNLFFFDILSCANLLKVVQNGNIDLSALFTCPTQQVCVEQCPTQFELGVRTSAPPICMDSVNISRFSSLNGNSILDYASYAELTTAQELVAEILNGNCAPYYVSSTSIANRCIPTLLSFDPQTLLIDLNNNTGNLSDYPLLTELSIKDITDGTIGVALLVNLRQFLLDVFTDFQIIWPGFVICIVISAALGFLVIFSMRILAPILIPLSIVLALAFVACISGFSFYQYAIFDGYLNISDPITEGLNTIYTRHLSWFEYQTQTWLAVGIISAVILLVLLLCVCCMICNIIDVIRVMIAASRAVWGVPESLIMPFLSWFLIIVIFLLWVSVTIFLLTSGGDSYGIIISNSSLPLSVLTLTNINNEAVEFYNGKTCDMNTFPNLFNITSTDHTILLNITNDQNIYETIRCQFRGFDVNNGLIVAAIFVLFTFLWIGNYVLALSECSLAGAFSIWYFLGFKLKKKVCCRFALLRGFLKAFLFHTGSLAIGSLIIATLQLIAFVLVFIQHRLQNNQQYKAVRWILRILTCMIICLERFFKYINRVIYIEIAIYGTGFFTGLCKAFKLFTSSPFKFVVKDSITTFMLFLVRIAIIALTAVIAYFLIDFDSVVTRFFYQGRMATYSLIPIMFLILISYLIASAFVSVYSMAIDTIFICLLEDRGSDVGKTFEVITKMRKMDDIIDDKSGGTVLVESPTASPTK